MLERVIAFSSVAAIAVALAPASAAAQSAPASTTQPALVTITHVDIPPLAGDTLSSDASDIDQQAHRLYVTERTLGGIDVFDVSTPTAVYLQTIPLDVRFNGISVAKNVDKLFVGMADSTLAVIDIDPASPTYYTVIARPSTGGDTRTDLTGYDPVHKKVYSANPGENLISVIDAVTNQFIKKIEGLSSNLEVPVYNPVDGMMYFTGSGLNVIYQIDPATDEIVNTFDVVDACSPNGIDINPTTNQALLGCSSRAGYLHTALWDFGAQKVVSTYEGVGGGDLVVYDPVVDRYFFGNAKTADGTSVMAIFRGSGEFLLTVPVGGNSPMYDQTNNMVYSADTVRGEAGLYAFVLPLD